MDRFVTARAPARASAQERRVVLSADQNDSRRGLLLEMTPEAEALVPRDQHSRIHRTVWLVTGGAAFAQGFVFEHKRPELCRVTLAAGLVFRK